MRFRITNSNVVNLLKAGQVVIIDEIKKSADNKRFGDEFEICLRPTVPTNRIGTEKLLF